MSKVNDLPSGVMLDASSFGVDERYQRSPLARLGFLRAIAKAFDPGQFGVIHVTKRKNGDYVIIDGAGRCHIYYVLLGRVGKVLCIVHDPMPLSEEARLFVDLNKNRRKVNSGDMFKAEVAANDKVARAINDIFTAQGMTIGRASGVDNIASVESAKTVFTRFGNLDRALAIKKNVWPKHVVGGGLLEGIALFLAATPDLDEPGFRKTLMMNLPGTTLAALKERGGKRMPLKRYIPQWAAEFWADEYNKHKKKCRASKSRIQFLASAQSTEDEDERLAA